MTATDRSLEALVDGQFGAQAATYLTSKVHAQGADLDALAALLRGRAGDRVLDLGCGAGHVGFAVAPKVREVVACDLSAGMLETVARAAAERGLRNLRTQQAVAAALPFEDAAFDAVLSRYSAHHWPDLGAGLREAARVLRPGGLFAVVDAVSPASPSRRRRPSGCGWSSRSGWRGCARRGCKSRRSGHRRRWRRPR